MSYSFSVDLFNTGTFTFANRRCSIIYSSLNSESCYSYQETIQPSQPLSITVIPGASYTTNPFFSIDSVIPLTLLTNLFNSFNVYDTDVSQMASFGSYC